MAISDTIQSMYTNVGEVYDTITNVPLPEHKNIENIPSTIRDSYLEIMNNGIDVVWDNWEKVVGEGTELTLSNTEQAPMKVLLKGNTYQDSTSISDGDAYDSPTPDHPQPVHVVSGDNEVEVSNGDNTQSTTYPINLPVENLFGGFTFSRTSGGITFSYSTNGSVNVNGTSTATANSINSNEAITNDWLVTLQPGTYAISGGTSQVRLQLVNSTGTGILSTSDSVFSNIITLDTQTSVFLRLSIPSGRTFNNVTIYPMLEKGSKANSFTPYGTTPIELCKIGTYQDRFIRNSGKNLLDRSACYVNYALNWTTGGKYGESGSLASEFIPTTKGTQYRITYSSQVMYYDSNKEYLGCLQTGGTTIAKATGNTWQIFTTPNIDEIAYMRLGIRKSSDGGEDKTNKNIMLNYGNTLLDYEPYGNGDWYLEKTLYKTNINIDGLQVYDIGTLKGSTMKAQNKIQSRTVCVLCSNAYEDLANKRENSFYENPANIMFIGSSTDTLQDLKNKFNGGTIYYPLATPTYTKIEGTLASQLEAVYRAKSEEGQTNISQTNNDLPFVLDVSALSKE